MQTIRRLTLFAALAAVLALNATGCATAPPNLSPQGVAAFQKTRVIKSLDLLRDFAIDAEAQDPKVLPTATTRKVVQYHQSALKVIQSTDAGWQSAVSVSLDEVVGNLDSSERAKVAPYVALVKAILTEVTR